MAAPRVPPVSARTRERWRSIALGTALFLLATALILAMHVLDPRRQAPGATEQRGALAAPIWSPAESLDRPEIRLHRTTPSWRQNGTPQRRMTLA